MVEFAAGVGLVASTIPATISLAVEASVAVVGATVTVEALITTQEIISPCASNACHLGSIVPTRLSQPYSEPELHYPKRLE